MPAPLRPLALTVLLGAGLLLGACASDPEPGQAPAADTAAADPAATVPAAPEEIVGAEDLLGDWVIMEQAGSAPEDVYIVSFTPTGEYLLRDEAGTTVRKTFQMAGPNLIAVADSEGVRRFTYETDGARLTLTIPGTENTTVLERYERIYND